MSRRTPNELEVGCKLADDVYNLDGALLFNRGLVINERHIEILQMWGIASVEIEGGPDERASVDLTQFSHTIVERAEAAVQRRYALNRSVHPALEVIRRISVLEAAKAAQVPRPLS